MPIRFPSGRTVAQAKKDAKRMARAQGLALHEAQDRVAAANGMDCGWAQAMARLDAAGQPAPSPLGFKGNTNNTMNAMAEFVDHMVTDAVVMSWHQRAVDLGFHDQALKQAMGELNPSPKDGYLLGRRCLQLAKRFMAAAGDVYPTVLMSEIRELGMERLLEMPKEHEGVREIVDLVRRGEYEEAVARFHSVGPPAS